MQTGKRDDALLVLKRAAKKLVKVTGEVRVAVSKEDEVRLREINDLRGHVLELSRVLEEAVERLSGPRVTSFEH